MTLEQLRKLNPEMQIYGVDDPAFAEYGRRITGADVTAIVEAGKNIAFPQEGSVYEAWPDVCC